MSWRILSDPPPHLIRVLVSIDAPAHPLKDEVYFFPNSKSQAAKGFQLSLKATVIIAGPPTEYVFAH